MLKDSYKLSDKSIRGFFKWESIDKDGNVIDDFFEENMIVDNARKNMCELIAGVSAGRPIDKFIIGTGGHHLAGQSGENILVPKDLSSLVDNPEGTAINKLFAETLCLYSYPIAFAGTGNASEDRTVTSEPDSALGSSTISIVQNISDVTYTIVLPSEVANNGGVVAYTEAGFYSGGDLFNIKTFPAKVKSAAVTIRITWKISF